MIPSLLDQVSALAKHTPPPTAPAAPRPYRVMPGTVTEDVLKCLRQGGTWTSLQLWHETGHRPTAILRALSRLAPNGLAECVGTTRPQHKVCKLWRAAEVTQ